MKMDKPGVIEEYFVTRGSHRMMIYEIAKYLSQALRNIEFIKYVNIKIQPKIKYRKIGFHVRFEKVFNK